MKQKLAWFTKLLYGSGDLGFSLTTTLIGAYFAIFLTDVVGVSPSVAAGAFFIGRSWDYVNDPIIGHLSDRTRTRWGRRRPFLLFGALPFGLAFAMLWWRPGFQRDLVLAIYYATSFVLFDTAATLVYMPYFSLTPELSSEYNERTSITTYRMFFSILGSLIAFTIPLIMIGTFRPENARKVLTMGFVFGLVSAGPLFLTFLGTRERREFMDLEQPKLFESLRAAFKNPPFLIGMGIFLGTWISVDIAQAILLYFIKYCVLRETQSDLIMGTIFVTAILALPLWNWVARRWNKRLAYIFGIAFWAAVQMVIITLGPSTPLAILLTLCALAGVGVAAAHVLPWSILPDAIEWDEWKTGKRHEGMFYSIVTLSHKVAASIAIPLVLLLLDAFKYQPNVTIQQPRAELAIRLITGPIPAVLLSLGILCAVFYPLSRERYNQIVRELEARRASVRALKP
ncbi:MAG: MFS transporter [Spirochaetaceae bacterium]|nr:MAG: MFS transporter [Spirochaetaceae bacterium]